MSRDLSAQTPVTFHDVAAYFSEEDWGQLEKWQKERYGNVMKGIHAALIAMGYAIINPNTFFRIRRGKELDARDQPGCEGNRDLQIPATTFTKTNPDILFRINTHEEPLCRKLQPSEEWVSVNSSPARDSDDHSDVILVINQDGEPYCINPPAREDGGNSSSAATDGGLVRVDAEDSHSVKRRGRRKPLRATGINHPLDNFLLPSGETSRKQSTSYWPVSETAYEGGATNQSFPIVQHPHQGGDRPFKCKFCEKCFTNTSNLNRHQRNHSGTNAYICNTCGKSFRDLHRLKVHQRTHTGERPYQCTECLKSFTNQHHLKGHWRIHTGERPYQCTVCERSFSQRHSLAAHQKTHAREQT